MDLHKQQLLRLGRQTNNIDEAEDRISQLSKLLLHHILSFLDIKCVARTSVLSKRWIGIWRSIPTLVFPCWSVSNLPSVSEVNKLMDFVDRTLHLHDASNIQKFHLETHPHMSASRVESWICKLARHNVEDLSLSIYLKESFYVPLCLFTSESLIKLELSASPIYIHLPKIFSFPKLKSLKLYGIRFTDDCWSEQHFSNCPVLEDLTLEGCTWFGVKNFCISTHTLKHLTIETNDDCEDDGLGNCALKIHAPNLVSLEYSAGSLAKDYNFSSFQTLEYAKVLLCEFGVLRVQQIDYGTAVCKFFRVLSHVQCLEVYPYTLEVLSMVDEYEHILPTFHDMEGLILKAGKITDKALFPLLKAVPNLRWLEFQEDCIDGNEEEHSWAGHMLTAESMFQYLESVTFVQFSGSARQMRWMKLILKNAKALQTVLLNLKSDAAIRNEVLIPELLSLPRATHGCLFEFY